MNGNNSKLNSGRGAVAITPSDIAGGNHPFTYRAIYVGGAGDITIVNLDNSTTLFKAVPVGTVLYVESRRVNATGTTATFLVGLK